MKPALLTTALLLAAAIAAQPCLAQAGHTPPTCSLLTPAQAQSVTGAPLHPVPGQNGDCTWQDAKGQDRIYLSVKPAGPEYSGFRSQMQASGRMTALPGIAEDAFYVASAGSSAPLYLLKKKHLIELLITGPDFARGQNEAAEKGLAPDVLAHF